MTRGRPNPSFVPFFIVTRESESNPELTPCANTTRKIAPKIDVAMPVGIDTESLPEITALSITSEPTTRMIPTIMDMRNILRAWLSSATQRAAIRASTGAHSPTKAIGPATVTALAARRTDKRTKTIRQTGTLSPKLDAASSPRCITSSLWPVKKTTTSTAPTTTASCRTPSIPICPNEPDPHATRLCVSNE